MALSSSNNSLRSLLLVLVGLVIGLLIERNNWFGIFESSEITLQGEKFATELNFKPEQVPSLISTTTIKDLLALRKKLTQLVWKQDQIPASLSLDKSTTRNTKYTSVHTGVRREVFSSKLPAGMESVVTLLLPEKWNKVIALYHRGHTGKFKTTNSHIDQLIEKGLGVMILDLPLFGANPVPILKLEKFGELIVTSHNHLGLIGLDDGEILSLFFTPIASAVNYALNNLKADRIFAIGFSGGAWAVQVYSALDPRVQRTYPIAGSLPIPLRTQHEMQFSDMEQWYEPLLSISNYFELYLLSSYGEDRKTLQIFNKFDSCCFWGERGRIYEKPISDILLKLGMGSFEVEIDETHHEHKVSTWGMNTILKDVDPFL